MYRIKVSHGYVDEPETWTVEVIGSYANREEAAEAAESKFRAVLEDIVDSCEDCFGEVESSLYSHYATYGAYDFELGDVFAGYNEFCKVEVIERRQHRRQRQARQARQLVCRI